MVTSGLRVRALTKGALLHSLSSLGYATILVIQQQHTKWHLNRYHNHNQIMAVEISLRTDQPSALGMVVTPHQIHAIKEAFESRWLYTFDTLARWGFRMFVEVVKHSGFFLFFNLSSIARKVAHYAINYTR